MSIYSLERETLQGLVDMVGKDRPNVGRRVRVTKGKHEGTVGVVAWHGKDKFSHSTRYMDDAAVLMMDARGTHGFRVRINPLQGGEPFFVSAVDVETIHVDQAEIDAAVARINLLIAYGNQTWRTAIPQVVEELDLKSEEDRVIATYQSQFESD